MSEQEKLKKEALKQLGEIHTTMMDSEKFMPFNFNALIMWGIVSVITFGGAEYFFKISTLVGSLFLIIVIGIGSSIDYFLIKKENKKYNIENFTSLQCFVNKIFTYNIIFGILFTLALISFGAIAYIPVLWIFVIGFAIYVTGATLNGKLYESYGKYNLFLSFILLGLTLILEASELAYTINNALALIFLGFGHIYVGIRLKYDYKKRGVSV